MRDLQDRIGRKRDELDVKAAEQDAEGAEDDAIDALDFAEWTAEQAEVAVNKCPRLGGRTGGSLPHKLTWATAGR